jgi:pyruvate formate lyase activating enzyme
VSALARIDETFPAPATVTSGRLHSWDLSTGVDGPGTRLVFFLSGCPLRCLYCQNPDTWARPGLETSLEDCKALIRRYRPFISLSGGGVTVSGGEPLQQPEFTAALFSAAKKAGLHTALDTSGFLGRHASPELLEATDLVLLDLKAGSDDAHRKLTLRPLAPTLRFAERLDALEVPVWIRYVLVPGRNDEPSEIDAAAAFAASLGNVERVEVLPFHTLGETKYAELNLPFPLAGVPTPTPDSVRETRARFAAHGLPVR